MEFTIKSGSPEKQRSACVVVGVFDSDKTAFDSEIWGDAEQMMAAFRRPVYSTLVLRLNQREALAGLKAAIEADPRVAGRLALWGRRLMGEALSQAQRVAAEKAVRAARRRVEKALAAVEAAKPD